MIKDELILKYSDIWNKSKEKYAQSRRLKLTETDSDEKKDYEIEQYVYSHEMLRVQEFLSDLKGLKQD